MRTFGRIQDKYKGLWVSDLTDEQIIEEFIHDPILEGDEYFTTKLGSTISNRTGYEGDLLDYIDNNKELRKVIVRCARESESEVQFHESMWVCIDYFLAHEGENDDPRIDFARRYVSRLVGINGSINEQRGDFCIEKRISQIGPICFEVGENIISIFTDKDQLLHEEDMNIINYPESIIRDNRIYYEVYNMLYTRDNNKYKKVLDLLEKAGGVKGDSNYSRPEETELKLIKVLGQARTGTYIETDGNVEGHGFAVLTIDTKNVYVLSGYGSIPGISIYHGSIEDVSKKITDYLYGREDVMYDLFGLERNVIFKDVMCDQITHSMTTKTYKLANNYVERALLFLEEGQKYLKYSSDIRFYNKLHDEIANLFI